MSDDEHLRRLLSDAVSDVEPHDRIAEIRASVHPDPEVVPMSRPRPWLYALSGAVASAAVIGVVAYATTALSGPNDDSGSFAAGQGHSRHPAAPVTTATASDSEASPSVSSPATSAPAVTSGTTAYAVYYVGADAAGKPVLYREWHRGPRLQPADPGGNGHDLLTQAVQDAVATLPLDPDYRTPWHDLATLAHASYGGTGAGDAVRITLDDSAIARRPTGMSVAEARAAVQQLVYTAQAAVGKRVPVLFTVGRKPQGPHPTLLGVDISKPVANAPILRTLSLVNISSPNEGDKVSGKLTVTGANNSFEGSSVIYLERHGKKYLTTPATGGWGSNRLFPWTVTLDLTKVQPGEYTLVAQNDDPSGQGHPDTDTRTVEVK